MDDNDNRLPTNPVLGGLAGAVTKIKGGEELVWQLRLCWCDKRGCVMVVTSKYVIVITLGKSM